MKLLDFKYKLKEHGWADTCFEIDGIQHAFEHGYCANPLRAVAKIAAALAKGTGMPRQDVLFDLEQEGQIRACFAHRDPTEFVLTRHREATSPGPSLPDGELLIGDKINSVAFAVCVGRELHQIVQSHGLTGYLRTWSHWAFPLQEYLYIRMFLDGASILDELASASPTESFGVELRVLQTEPSWSQKRLSDRFPHLDPWE